MFSLEHHSVSGVEALDKEIIDASQLISLLLVFISVLFSLKYTALTDLLREPLPDAARRDARTDLRDRLYSAMWAHLFPVALPSSLLAIALAPDSARVLVQFIAGHDSLDLLRVLFLFLEGTVVVSVGWCVATLIRFVVKIRQVTIEATSTNLA